MALSSISTHKLACIFAPIDIPKTAESKQSQIAASGASNAAICAPKIVYTISSLINPYCMLVIRATVSTCPETPLLMSCVNGNLSFIFDVNGNISFTVPSCKATQLKLALI